MRGQPLTPSAVDHLVRTCLAKDPEERWQNAHDSVAELRWIQEAGSQAGVPLRVVVRRRLRTRLAWSAGGMLMGVLLGGAAFWSLESRATPQPVTHLRMGVQPAEQLGGSLRTERSFDGLERPTRTDLAFSPGGEWVGFWAEGKLKKVSTSGGLPVTVCEAHLVYGATWGANDTIVFARVDGGLLRVPADGGTPEALTTLEDGEFAHRLPRFLPGGEALLFTVQEHASGSLRDVAIALQMLATGERRVPVN